MAPPLRSRDPDERATRPANRDLHAVAPLALLHLDVQEHELGRRQDEVLVARGDADLAGQQALGQLREIESGRVTARPAAELLGDRRRHALPFPWTQPRPTAC